MHGTGALRATRTCTLECETIFVFVSVEKVFAAQLSIWEKITLKKRPKFREMFHRGAALSSSVKAFSTYQDLSRARM